MHRGKVHGEGSALCAALEGRCTVWAVHSVCGPSDDHTVPVEGRLHERVHLGVDLCLARRRREAPVQPEDMHAVRARGLGGVRRRTEPRVEHPHLCHSNRQ